MRVVHADGARTWRGGQQQLLLLASALRARGCSQLIVAAHAPVAARYRAAGFEVAAPLPALARVRGATIVHAHDGRAHSWMLAATALFPGPRRVLSRRVAFPIPRGLSAWKYRRLDAVIAVSRYVAAEVARTGIPPARIAVVPDAVDLDALPAARTEAAALRARLALAGRRVLVCVSAFTPEKGVADLVAAMDHLPPDYVLLLAGEGAPPSASDRIRNVAALGASIPAWVAAADALVIPSRLEGLGSAALLAMALAVPVVATCAGGLPELIADGETGVLAPIADPAALAAAVRRLEDEPLRRALVAAARAQVDQRFTVAAMAGATVAVYERLTGAAS